MKTLLTGGAGYIGTHILCALAEAKRESVVIDNYSNSSPRSLERVREILGKPVEAYEIDIRDKAGLDKLLTKRDIDSVIHLAGLKAVGESVEQPELYHANNVAGTRVLLDALQQSSVRKFVFSSSAVVYGAAEKMPLDESSPVGPLNPYGQNKLDIEVMLSELARRDPTWRVINLRYFNPVGAHPSGLIGEHPQGIPNNLMPYVCQTAVGTRAELRIFGNDYPTPDGTGVRDYIHVMDLAEGHVQALAALEKASGGTVMTVNLGTGRGYSVLELIETFERVNGVRIPRRVVARRPGDTAICYADARCALTALGWKSKRGIEEMCRDAWHWQRKNPRGFVGS